MGLHENLLRGIYAYGGFLAAVTLSGQPLASVQLAFVTLTAVKYPETFAILHHAPPLSFGLR